jgi:uncharacterized membrane protein YgdD (TMEM256/DUF423 family)
MVWIGIAAASGALAVVAGAFGAHALTDQVSPQLLSTWNTAVHYHLLHSVALLALGLFSHATQKGVDIPSWLFVLGILLFSGSLYGLVLTQQTWLGPVTPIGGMLLIAGWLSLLWLGRA